MAKLVSVIIPCFNAEKWIAEAIGSCLNQTYSAVEIIIIDDGSTDGSLDVIKRYGDRVIWESGPNRGGNYARNQGFALSKGDYIQYLDADDYLLPEKLERQVHFLEETAFDVVYGDWRHQYHLPNGDSYLEDIKVTGNQPDLLESLLADWWVSPACLLFKRSPIAQVGGWDESLKAGQDRDFFLSIVMSGAKVGYQSGCYSIYRRHGNVTVSTSSKTRYLESHQIILEKAEKMLLAEGKLSQSYRDAMAQSYFMLARGYLEFDPPQYFKLLEKTLTLSPKFQANSTDRTAAYTLAQRLFGFRNLERIVFLIKQTRLFLFYWLGKFRFSSDSP
ncbi:glycosyltransferase [Leptolyngbya sp. FACHB-671]|uniref:glycosyltransferase n=1 Tax=Leptolyngbya sp. FACHB-671 TaxID=2692812 RepID=UPI0016861C72|nr:glycosyltransferase [Leptolyngbya sp. FACHB-671]MBD2070605.1 glycosyltransferase [Leptolyngbya sp. FACHB-671]